jgi:hypothetical protein
VHAPRASFPVDEATAQAEPGNRLEAQLVEARKPALVRLLEAFRRR